MKTSFLYSLFLLSLVFYVGLPAFAETEEAKSDSLINSIPPSTNQIMKLTDQGLLPNQVELRRAGSSVFFLNRSLNQDVRVEINYGKKLAYCASGGMAMDDKGVFRSKSPISPEKFVTVCFPQAGSYPVEVSGLSADSAKFTGRVIVKDDGSESKVMVDD